MSAPRSSDDDALVLEALGHVAADDALGQALDDGGLADARLADEDRVVLRPAAEDLDDPPDLVVAADDRIELAGAGLGGQVAAVLLEGLVGALRVGRGDPLAAADALERLQDRLVAGAVALEEVCASPPASADAEEQVLGRDVLVAEAAGLFLRPLDDALGARVEGQRAALDPGALGKDRRELAAERGQVDAEAAKRLGRHAVVRLDERAEQVLGVEDGLCSRSAVSWAARTASWAFSVKRSSCMGSGLSGAGVGLVDEVEEAARGLRASSDRSVGRMTLAWTNRSPWPSPLKRGMPWPVSRNVRPGWVPGGIVSRTRPLGSRPGPPPPSSASRERERELALEVGAAAGERPVAARCLTTT